MQAQCSDLMGNKVVFMPQAQFEEWIEEALRSSEKVVFSDKYPSSNSAKALEFMRVFDQRTGENIFDARPELLRLLALRLRLVRGEVDELGKAVDDFTLWSTMEDLTDFNRRAAQGVAFEEMVDALADILYAAYGFLHAVGVDPDRAFDEVHRSNMTKLDAHGQPIYREDGQVLKGPGYVPPDWSRLLNEYDESFSTGQGAVPSLS